jgi:hypothetical protein
MPYIRFASAGSQSNNTFMQLWGPGTDNIFNITNQAGTGVSLTSGAQSWGTVSDSRLKTIIEPISNATAGFETITPMYFTLNADTDKIRRIGVIAQEILPHFPETVSQSGDGMYGVRYSELIAPLITAVKELSGRLSNVEAKLAATTTS